MLEPCRTCLKLIHLTSIPHFEIEAANAQLSPTSSRFKILSVIPEMALNISKRSLLCVSCHQNLESIYEFKMKCLRTESMIMRYIHTKPDLIIDTLDLKHVAVVNNTGYVAGFKPQVEEPVVVKQECIPEEDDFMEAEGVCDENITVVKHEITNDSYETELIIPPENKFLNVSIKSDDIKVDFIEKFDHALKSIRSNENVVTSEDLKSIKSDLKSGYGLRSSSQKNDDLTSSSQISSSQNDVTSSDHKIIDGVKLSPCSLISSIHKNIDSLISSCRKSIEGLPLPPENIDGLTPSNHKDNVLKSFTQQNNNDVLQSSLTNDVSSSSHKLNDVITVFNNVKAPPNINDVVLSITTNNGIRSVLNENGKSNDSGILNGSGSEQVESDVIDYDLRCPVCFKNFITKSRLKTHMLCHTDERPYKCTFCTKGFNDKSTLKKHLKIHSGVKEYECDICQRQFYCKGNMNKHMSTHSGERPYKCEVCDKDFSRNEHLKQHKLIHTGVKLFECDICSKKFARRDSLIIHMMVHTGVRNYICEYCDKRCIDSSTLKKHLRSHTGDKPYECETCNRRFTQKTHLTIHRRKHTGERPFPCTVCSKAFFSSNYLKIHKRTHTKEQPYQCDVCEKRFSTISNLSMHKKIHTGIRDFECGICSKLFIHKHDLRKHIMVHTQEKPFSCHVCSRAFNKKVRARQHIINMHKDVDISTVVIERHSTTIKTEPKIIENAGTAIK